MLDRTIKKILIKDEKIEKAFSFSEHYINLRFFFSLIKWSVLFLIFSFIFIFAINYNQLAPYSGLWNNEPIEEIEIYDNENPEILSLASLNKLTQNNIWLACLAFLVFVIFPILLFYHFYYLKTANCYVFTDKRVLVKKGWLSTYVKSIMYDRITDASSTEGFIDKIIFDSGSLRISTAGSEGYEMVLRHVSKPHSLKQILYDLKEKDQKNNNQKNVL